MAGLAKKAAVLEVISSGRSTIENDDHALWDRLHTGRIPDDGAKAMIHTYFWVRAVAGQCRAYAGRSVCWWRGCRRRT